MSETPQLAGALDAGKFKFGIVISRFNEFFTRQLLSGALDCLARHGAAPDRTFVVWVPGAYEIPLVAKALAQSGKYDAVIAIGAVIRGATAHAELISTQVTRALTQIALEFELPVIDGVVVADNLEQAVERSGTKAGNRGWNAALSAIEMAAVMRELKKK